MIWLAFYWDRSGMAIFGDELDARRFADPRHMEVREVPLGVDVWEFLNKE